MSTPAVKCDCDHATSQLLNDCAQQLSTYWAARPRLHHAQLQFMHSFNSLVDVKYDQDHRFMPHQGSRTLTLPVISMGSLSRTSSVSPLTDYLFSSSVHSFAHHARRHIFVACYQHSAQSYTTTPSLTLPTLPKKPHRQAKAIMRPSKVSNDSFTEAGPCLHCLCCVGISAFGTARL